MSLTLSERCLGISPSLTLSIDAKAKKLRAEGNDVIGFAAGEPDFDTPEYIRNAAKEALDKGLTRYTPVAGMLLLREEIAHKLKKDNDLVYGTDQIVVTTGAKQALFNAFCAILNPGDEVIIPSPCWVSYPEMVKMAGGVPVMVEGLEDDGFLVTAGQLSKAVTPRSKAIVLNSPNNPNGCVWGKELLIGIAQLAVREKLFVISDEIYEKLIYDDLKHVSIASLGEDIKNQTIVINGMSKSYAMTGWRLGYAAGPRDVIKAMTSFQSHSTSNACSITQYAGAMALTNGDEYMKSMVKEFDARRKLMHSKICAIDGLSAHLPEGAFYMMLNIQSVIGKKIDGTVIKDSMDFADKLLEKKLVAVVPGVAFGAPYHVRLSYATSRERISEGLDRIGDFVSSLEDCE